MGQKADARILRLGVNNNIYWKSKYIEKSPEESSLYLYKTLEIRKYLNQFFSLHKIKVQNCKIFYSNNLLKIFVSFYVTKKTLSFIKSSKKKKKVYKNKRKLTRQQKKFTFKSTFTENKKVLRKRYPHKQINNYQSFQEVLLECLTLYTRKKVNIMVSLQHLNNNIKRRLSNNHKKTLKVLIKQLKKFTKKPFFKEMFNILVVSSVQRDSTKLLSEFISNQLKFNQLRNDQDTAKRKDNYFLGFLKQTIKLLIVSSFSRITGIKIVIKGRFNKAPRAKCRIIQFGVLSLQSFDSKIDYFQSTAYTINGTFGVKVWIQEN